MHVPVQKIVLTQSYDAKIWPAASYLDAGRQIKDRGRPVDIYYRKRGSVSYIREVLQHVILAKKPYERRLRGAAPILYVILVRKPRNERPRYGLST